MGILKINPFNDISELTDFYCGIFINTKTPSRTNLLLFFYLKTFLRFFDTIFLVVIFAGKKEEYEVLVSIHYYNIRCGSAGSC